MTKQLWRGLFLSAALVMVLGCVPVAVRAEDDNSGSDTTTTSTEQENETEDQNDDNGSLEDRLQELKQKRQENQQHRLEANKLRVCELHKTKIKAIVNRSITRAERQLALFSTIAERVEAFYVKKGKTVANYDELVAAVNTAKTQAQTDLETLKGLPAFDCNADDPKGVAEGFKEALKTVNQDLKNYRTAVKNLIVAVKSAQSTTAGEQEGGDQ